ncbi:hypothetical protein Tco_1146622 [Tanacetum coccineum]
MEVRWGWDRCEWCEVWRERVQVAGRLVRWLFQIGWRRLVVGCDDGGGGDEVGDGVVEVVILKGKLVLTDDDGKSLEKVDYLVNSDSDDAVEPVKNETAKFFASEGVGYGP